MIKMLPKGVCAALLPPIQLYNLGINPGRIIGQLCQILDASKETENATDVADGLFSL